MVPNLHSFLQPILQPVLRIYPVFRSILGNGILTRISDGVCPVIPLIYLRKIDQKPLIKSKEYYADNNLSNFGSCNVAIGILHPTAPRNKIDEGVDDWYRKGVYKPHWEDGHYHGLAGRAREGIEEEHFKRLTTQDMQLVVS